MATELPQIDNPRLSGTEPFTEAGDSLGFDVLAFWQWSASRLLDNTTRGLVAEFLVAQALGVAAGAVRREWDPYDIVSAEGITVEVKSASYIQSWYQKRPSTISFSVKKTLKWNPENAVQETTPRRQADVYAFCLLHHMDQATINPLDVAQWRFYAVTTSVLDAALPTQQRISLSALEGLCSAVPYSGLAGAVRDAPSRKGPVPS